MSVHDSGDHVLAADGDENAAARHLIDTLGLASALVSVDTLYCCVDTAQMVPDRDFDYLL